MGSCCSNLCKTDRKVSYAYRTELGSDLVIDLLPKLEKLPSNSSRVLIIRLKGIHDLDLPSGISRINPYVEMKLRPADSVAGEQYQRSSYKSESQSPKWEPDEKFQFILTDSSSADVVISVYSFVPGKNADPIPLGDAVLKSKDIKGYDAVFKPIKIVKPANGRPNGVLNVQIQLKSIKQALSCEEHTIYQYERWQPLYQTWGAEYPGHLLPTDPGKWSTVDGTKFGKEIDDVAPALKENWKVERDWYTLANDDDPEGWQYAIDFSSYNWYSKQSGGVSVRRRAWRREVVTTEKEEAVAKAIRRGRRTTDDD